jgi:DNA mismatch repair ATPase MutL
MACVVTGYAVPVHGTRGRKGCMVDKFVSRNYSSAGQRRAIAHPRALCQPRREQLLNDLLSLMACHAAVCAGDRLTSDAIQELLAQRELVQNSHHCPHGRPTSLRFTRHDLERHFKRV